MTDLTRGTCFVFVGQPQMYGDMISVFELAPIARPDMRHTFTQALTCEEVASR